MIHKLRTGGGGWHVGGGGWSGGGGHMMRSPQGGLSAGKGKLKVLMCLHRASDPASGHPRAQSRCWRVTPVRGVRYVSHQCTSQIGVELYPIWWTPYVRQTQKIVQLQQTAFALFGRSMGLGKGGVEHTLPRAFRRCSASPNHDDDLQPHAKKKGTRGSRYVHPVRTTTGTFSSQVRQVGLADRRRGRNPQNMNLV